MAGQIKRAGLLQGIRRCRFACLKCLADHVGDPLDFAAGQLPALEVHRTAAVGKARVVADEVMHAARAGQAILTHLSSGVFAADVAGPGEGLGDAAVYFLGRGTGQLVSQ